MFRVSARTILELGSELISSDIIAFYELIKNGFDAATTNGVEIKFSVILRKNEYLTLLKSIESKSANIEECLKALKKALIPDAPKELIDQANRLIEEVNSHESLAVALKNILFLNNIEISDRGTGMSISDLNEKFLVIGTGSRKKAVDEALRSGASESPYLGEKGIGRLSAMRLGNYLEIKTARKVDSTYNVLRINWEQFSNIDAMIEDIKVSPIQEGAKPFEDWSGTHVIVRNLSEDWSETRVKSMVDHDFSRLTDPFSDSKKRPRIVIYWNGQRLSIPWMDKQLLDNAHASIKGSYEIVDGNPRLTCDLKAIDLGFDHPEEQQISVDSSVDLESILSGASIEIHDDALISVGPFTFDAYWYNRRRLRRIDGIGEISAVKSLQTKWSGILLFRDGFRIFPYGEDDDDWLGLDRRALGRKGYLMNKTQFIGRVNVSRTKNPNLVDQTNREGLRETPEQQVIVGVIQHALNTQLYQFLQSVEVRHKKKKFNIANTTNQILELQKRAKTAIKDLKRKVPASERSTIEELQQTLLELTNITQMAQDRVKDAEKESRQMVELAGVGLMVEVVAHELARASEAAINNLNQLSNDSAIPLESHAVLSSLKAQMNSLSKRIRILDPMSISGRQRKEIFCINQLIIDTLKAHEGQFERHGIKTKVELPKDPVNVKAVKGMVVQILENLISNSKYWLEIKRNRLPDFRSVITVKVSREPVRITYSDNGRGIDPLNREKIFAPFFSLKEKSKRRGIGLYIARECAEYHNGSLELTEEIDPDTGRLHTFVLELPYSKIS